MNIPIYEKKEYGGDLGEMIVEVLKVVAVVGTAFLLPMAYFVFGV